MHRVLSLALAAVFALGAPCAASTTYDTTRTTLRQYVLTLINRDREAHGLTPVLLDDGVSALGDSYCHEQIRTGTTGHFTTDGLSPYMRYSFAGGDDAVNENAAAWSAGYAFTDRALRELVQRSQVAMMAEKPPSDGHRRAILDPYATHVGIGLAWKGGEFRLVQEFVRRWLVWSRPFPRYARITDAAVGAARAAEGVAVEAISVYFEPLPRALTARAASARDEYSLPQQRREYLPRLRADVRRSENGSLTVVRAGSPAGRVGDFPLTRDGAFSFEIPFTDGAGIYTVVVWVRPPGATAPVAASTVSIRVEGSVTQPAQGHNVTR